MRAWRFMATNRQYYFLLALMLGISLGFMLSVGPIILDGDGGATNEPTLKGGCATRVISSGADLEPPLLVLDPNVRAGPLGPNEKVLELLRQDQRRRLILVGVMTAQKYLDTRAVAVYNTWARSLPGHVIFFTGAHALADPALPVVRLPTVDDTYPPQKKSFLMLKFMSENFVGRYEWFMRADDDVYVRGDRLEAFLRSINSSKPQFIGQAGMGNKEEFGQLNLEPEENFCMGGPGIVFSGETLRLVGPNIRHCLKNLYSTHEDVEVGRCVRLFAHISCTWSYEMQTIFYHNSSGNLAFTGHLKQREIHRAITLHPIKQHHHFYRLHNYFISLKMKDILQTNNLLHRDIKLAMDNLEYPKRRDVNEGVGYTAADMPQTERDWTDAVAEAPLSYAAETRALSERHNLPVSSANGENGKAPSLIKTLPRNDSEVLKWEFIHRAIYSYTHSNPRRAVNPVLSETLNDVVNQIMELINRFAKQRGRVIDFKDILYAYQRFDPRHGADYILDLLLVYKKYRGRKMTLPVRKHMYVQRAFTDLQLRSVPHYPLIAHQATEDKHSLKMNEKRINFILPLAGRLKIFQRFVENFERVCLRNPTSFSVSLSVVLFPEANLNAVNNNETARNVKYLVDNLRTKYGGDLDVIQRFETFSRARALELGSSRFGEDQLLLFIDVDMHFDEYFVHRVCSHTVFETQAYFPIVFSQYNPKFNAFQSDVDAEKMKIDENVGYWRFFGFGIVSLYKGDLRKVGGLDTKIEGWGQEDVDLYDKVIRSELKVFRASDPGLMHVFHSIECDDQLAAVQLAMCQGSKASSLASIRNLAKIIYDHPDIIQTSSSHVEKVVKDDKKNSDRQR